MGDLRQKSVGRAPNLIKRTEKDIFIHQFIDILMAFMSRYR